MKTRLSIVLAIGTVLAVLTSVAAAEGLGTDLTSAYPDFERAEPASDGFRGARLETLWIFDADFSTTTGDNAGWTAYDRSGTLGQTNWWHHDTIRIDGFAHLGDSTWWCGTYNVCWRQPRGYGNDWMQFLSRSFSGVSGVGGDAVELEFDQRFAMERLYDYGYVDIWEDGASDWTTLASYNNGGFAGAGLPRDWDYPATGHITLDLSMYAGLDFDLRFRFESDGAYSSQDQYDNPQHSVKDGAWQLDNITITVNGTPTFEDDSESGNMGWVHDDLQSAGQTGVQFWRGQYVYDFETGREFSCEDRDPGSYMYVAVDPFSSTMVDGEYTWLMSPPIDISGAPKLVGVWDMWVDLPRPTNDIFNLSLASDDLYECVTDPAGFVDESPGWWYGGPFWGVWRDDWDAFAGNDWLAIRWELRNDDPATAPHMAGIFLNRQKVGIPSGDAGTAFERDTWNSFNDWFKDDLADALQDTALIKVKDDDEVATLYLMASNDDGQTWEAYPCAKESPQSDWWQAPPPANQMTPASEIHYYYEATDEVGNTSTYPGDAPNACFEMSILPIRGSIENPGVLLVDKHGRRTPGEDRRYRHTSEYYFREALEILGYEYDVYDVEVPSGSIKSDGPDTCGMKYYDTQIWFASVFDYHTLLRKDQRNLIEWLSQAEEGKERNLLLSGDDIGRELVEAGAETLSFYQTWLASDYVQDTVGDPLVDSLPVLRDVPGSFAFMTHGDGQCILAGGCPLLNRFDVVQPYPGIEGAETVAEYVRTDLTALPAGVAYTDSAMGYQTVNLGFGIESMMDDLLPNGYYESGIADRSDLLSNIMEYFAKDPSGPGTGSPDDQAFVNALRLAHPNPFNPATTIKYSVGAPGQVTVLVYNLAGRVVRTLVDETVEPGRYTVVWDGTTDTGDRAASGVYFVRMEAAGFRASRKAVLLK